MKIIVRIAAISCLALLLMCSQVVNTNAQGRYANVYSRSQVDNYVRQLEMSSNQFRDAFRQEVNNSGLNSSTKRTYNSYAAQFENAVDRLRNRFNSSNTWWESRSEVSNTISNSQNLNSVMNDAAFARRLERQWNQLRRDINRLADTYDMPGLSGGGWNGNGGRNNGGGVNDGGSWNGGGRQGNVPSWAEGTFYARNPQTGGVITMTVERNGSVMIDFGGGNRGNATINGTRLVFGSYVNDVTRINNGFRTTNISTGEYIDYYRTPINGGIVGPGVVGSGGVPSWAIGTFYARNPRTGGVITMNVERNGIVMIDFGDGNRGNATINGTRLVFDSYVNDVTRINNGFRTTNIATGEFIDYYRNRPF